MRGVVSLHSDRALAALRVQASVNAMSDSRERQRAEDASAQKDKYRKADQHHIFRFFDSLLEADQEAFLTQIKHKFKPDQVNAAYEAASTAARHQSSFARGELTPPPQEACDSVVAAEKETLRELSVHALSPIGQGKVAVVLLAGGQGTRLGSALPKGCFNIGLPSGKSLFQLQAERIRRLATLACVKSIPLYIMTSQATRQQTEGFFFMNDCFGLRREDVIFFDQDVLPALDNRGKFILESKSSVAVAPNGNGGLYAALRSMSSAGVSALEDMHDRKIDFVHAYCVDNCLVKVPDPIFLGYCISKGVECGIKVVRKEEPSESVGVVVQKSGRWAVAEYSEIPKELTEQRDADGKLTFRAANIANHFFTVAFLDRVRDFEDRIPYHIAHKKIPHIDLETGELVSPTEPNGVKLERFIFDVFAFAKSLAVLEVDREEEFSPLKNASGTGTDDPETSRKAVLDQHRRWLEAVGTKFVGENVEVEISPLISFGGENLQRAAKRTVKTSCHIESEDQLGF